MLLLFGKLNAPYTRIIADKICEKDDPQRSERMGKLEPDDRQIEHKTGKRTKNANTEIYSREVNREL